MLSPDWLDRQIQEISEDVKHWPGWLQRAAGLTKFAETQVAAGEVRFPNKIRKEVK